jgi:NitT/TauT family transport system permease protein
MLAQPTLALEFGKELLLRHQNDLRANRRRVLTIQIVIAVGVLVAWEMSVRLGFVRELLIGQPSRVVEFLINRVIDGSLLRDAWVTTVETLVGFAGGLVLGAACGLAIWWSKTAEQVLDPLIIALNSLPKIALTPILLLWFGVGISMKIALAFATVFLVTFLSAATSLRGLDKELMQLTSALGATRSQQFLYVVVPSSLPWLLSATKICIGFALTGAVVGEFVAANQGIGYVLLYGAQLYEMSLVWAGIATLLVIAMAMYETVAMVERRLFRWRDN